MAEWIYMNGAMVPAAEAVVSVFDHGLLYGDGVFEGIRIYNGRVFKLDEHVHRLFDSARAISLEIPLTAPQFREVVLDTARRNGLSDGYIRAVVTRGVGDLGIDPISCPSPTVFIIADGITLYPARLYDEGLAVVTASVRRVPEDCLSPRIKSLNYLNNILGKMEARRQGATEAILLNRDGYVSEGTANNLFIMHDGALSTPSRAMGVLEGITRHTVMALAVALGYTVREEMLTLYDLYAADECFLTGTGAEVVPVVHVDGRRIGAGTPGPGTRRLMEAYRTLTRSTGTPIGVPVAAGRNGHHDAAR